MRCKSCTVQCSQGYDKMSRLQGILRSKAPGSRIIIFCSTKRMCDQLASNLRSFGATAIHGDKKQQERDWVRAQLSALPFPVLFWLCGALAMVFFDI